MDLCAVLASERQHLADEVERLPRAMGSPLTDVVVHGADVLRPLGRARTIDPDALRSALTFVATRKAAKGFGTSSIASLTVEATTSTSGSAGWCGCVGSRPGPLRRPARSGRLPLRALWRRRRSSGFASCPPASPGELGGVSNSDITGT